MVNDFHVLWLDDEQSEAAYVGTYHGLSEAVEGLIQETLKLFSIR